MSDNELAATAAGIDYSYGRPGGAAIREAGFSFAMRYLGPPSDPRCITPEERDDLHGSGVAIGLIWETAANRALSGFAGGRDDARAALDWMVVLGAPEHVACYMTCDFDTDPSNIDTVVDYVHGAASVMGYARTGIYGEYEVIAQVSLEDACRYLWQCRAWSGSPVRLHPERHLYQPFPGGTVNGALVDYDAAYGPDQGLWMPPQQEDDSMSDNDILAVFGSTERDADGNLLPPEQRLVFARARYNEAIATGQSVFEMAGQAKADARNVRDALALHMTIQAGHEPPPVTSAPEIPEHTHESGKVKR